MEELTIRAVEKGELAKCAEIVNAAFNVISEKFGFATETDTTRILIRLQDSLLLKAKMFGAFVGDEQVGFVEIDEKDPEVFEVLRLCVLPEHQGKGYGQALLDQATAYILSMGGIAVVCTIINANKKLKRWLMANGFNEEASGAFGGLPRAICLMQKDMINQCSCA